MIVQVFLRTVFISFPEELFLTLFILLCSNLLKFLSSPVYRENRFKLKDFYRFGSISVIAALYSQILRQFDINEFIQFFSTLLLMYLLIIFLYGCTTKNLCIKVSLYTAFAGGLLVLFESYYYLIIVKLINYDLIALSKSVWLASLCTIPERLLMCSVIVFFIKHYKTRNECKKGFFELLLANKTFTFITSVLVFCVFICIFIIGRLILFKRILSSLPLYEQLLYISIMFSTFIIILFCYFLGLYSHLKRDYTDRHLYGQNIDIIKERLSKLMPFSELKDDNQKLEIDTFLVHLNTLKRNILDPLDEKKKDDN